ncbi:hypothetical protein [Pseudomonas guariconensis]|uniref:hypothetical protein n=1 Tax=Pseudomonas guariconensis TaxID=1288410 RepID=UPI0039067900
MSQSIGEFIKDKVYPVIDAVDKGLLDHLHPKTQHAAKDYYVLDCPACRQDRAFYYPGRAGIQCNRKENCKSPYTSLWDAIALVEPEPRAIVEALCRAAAVDPPDRRDQRNGQSQAPGASAPARPSLSVGQAIFHVTQGLAKQHKHVLDQFQQARGYTDEVMAQLKLGVFTTNAEVLNMLSNLGISKEQAREKAIITYEDDTPDKVWSGMEGRVIGYWPHPDGDVRIWGRLPVGSGEPKKNPKYRFSPRSCKDIPYLFRSRQSSILVCVEGTLDAWALQLLGIWGAAIGQASINGAQAAYLASKGITEAAHMVDGDRAGWEGALSSIREAEAVGITLSIITLGQGQDDADAMRVAGRGDELRSLVESRMNAGEYLAHFCAGLLAKSPPDLRGVGKIRHTAKGLGPVSLRKWRDYSQSLGLFPEERTEAIQSLNHLLSAGLSIDEGIALVKRRTGYQISITKEASHG